MPEVALVVAALHYERHAILPQPGQKLAADAEAGRAVGQALLDAGKGEREASHGRQGDHDPVFVGSSRNGMTVAASAGALKMV
jgi:hypothetical protein